MSALNSRVQQLKRDLKAERDRNARLQHTVVRQNRRLKRTAKMMSRMIRQPTPKDAIIASLQAQLLAQKLRVSQLEAINDRKKKREEVRGKAKYGAYLTPEIEEKLLRTAYELARKDKEEFIENPLRGGHRMTICGHQVAKRIEAMRDEDYGGRPAGVLQKIVSQLTRTTELGKRLRAILKKK